jgi:N-acyl homoserine lactone hydrolase
VRSTTRAAEWRWHHLLMGSTIHVQRVDFGYFVRPGEETATGSARVEPVLGYLVDHPRGRLLMDTGLGAHPDVDAHYRPRRTDLSEALRSVGSHVDDISAVVNCHLHFDHCGNNPALTNRPIYVQGAELSNARSPDYTLPALVDAPGVEYEEISGEAEIWEGVTVMPTPGHTSGHQSLIVRHQDGTVVVLAGQSHDTATDFSADMLAVRATADGHQPAVPISRDWVRRLRELDPSAVYFAHDHAVWIPR